MQTVDPPSSDQSFNSEEPTWEALAEIQQQTYFEYLGDRLYDSYRRRIPSICCLLLGKFCECLSGDELCYNDSEITVLKSKIGFGLFGNPLEVPSEENKYTGYRPEELQLIEKIFENIVRFQNGNEVLMAILYVCLEKTGQSGVLNLVVFRIPNHKNNEEFSFVDCHGRLYSNWSDFVDNNKLPGAKWCYPRDGVYSGSVEGKVDVCFGITPQARLSSKVLKVFDRSASAVAIGSTIGTFFPPATVVCIGTGLLTSAYSIVRTSFGLADKKHHGGSLTDRESIMHWASICSTSLGIGSCGGMAAVKLMAQQGREISTIVCGLVTGLNYSSMFVNGACIVENCVTATQQKEWDALQVFQVGVSVAFFAHSVVNAKTAYSIYSETQAQILENHGTSLSKRQRKLFNGMQKETLKYEKDPMVGRAKIINQLNHISNKREFFAGILKSNKAEKQNSKPLEKVKFGSIQEKMVTSSHSFSTRPTCGVSGPVPYSSFNSAGSSSYINVHEPALFTKIKKIVGDMDRGDVYRLLNVLDDACKNSKFGRVFMRAVRILHGFYQCDSLPQFMQLLKETMDFGSELWEDLLNWRRSFTEGQVDEEQVLCDVLQGPDFIPSLLNAHMSEEVYHFPLSHRAWGKDGELYLDEYKTIGENIFGISNVESTVIVHEGIATVYFERYGLVTITSHVRDQKMVIKKFVIT